MSLRQPLAVRSFPHVRKHAFRHHATRPFVAPLTYCVLHLCVAAAAPAATSPADTIGKLRDALETCEKREEHLNRKVDNEIKQAKLFSQQNKKREAIQCLKRKKMYEQQIANLEYASATKNRFLACSNAAALGASDAAARGASNATSHGKPCKPPRARAAVLSALHGAHTHAVPMPPSRSQWSEAQLDCADARVGADECDTRGLASVQVRRFGDEEHDGGAGRD